MIKSLLLAFIPIFVAVDAIGVLPIFVSFTQGLSRKEKIKIIFQSMITAICLAVFFIFLGKAVFKLLGISMGDFLIAGGLILFSIAIIDIINPNKKRRIPISEVGAVPLGTPLIVGPAVLATSLIIIGVYGLYATLLSVVLNVLIAGLIFFLSDYLIKLIGESGSKALSKVTSLLLAAIAIMMVRKGIMQFFN
ncbi:MAG: MarC family protein [Candidatus Omnitrophota bacterium]